MRLEFGDGMIGVGVACPKESPGYYESVVLVPLSKAYPIGDSIPDTQKDLSEFPNHIELHFKNSASVQVVIDALEKVKSNISLLVEKEETHE